MAAANIITARCKNCNLGGGPRGGARRLPGNFGPLREKQLLTSVCAAVIIVKLSDAYEPLAQLAEQLPFKQWVRGSNPRRLTMLPQTAAHRKAPAW